MKIALNPDKNIVEEIQNGLKESGGYCPCSLIRDNDDYKCMCKEFRDMIKNLEYGKTCHCGLYLICEKESN